MDIKHSESHEVLELPKKEDVFSTGHIMSSGYFSKF